MRLSKREAIRLCRGCSKLMQEACVFADIERTKDAEIDVPVCLKKIAAEKKIKSQTHLGAFVVDETLEQPLIKKRKSRKTHTDTHPQVALTFKLDNTDLQILKLIKEGCYRNEILRKTDKPATTVRGRLDKLVKNHIIMKNPEALGFRKLGYVITNRWVDTTIKQELGITEPAQLKPEKVKFTKHACSFKSEILTGCIPKGDSSYSPNNWTGQVFHGENYDIRVIPKKGGIGMAVIDIKVSLGAGTEADLNTKYFELAMKGLGEWSQRYKVQISRPEFYRAPHTVIEGSRGLAEAILGTGGGEVYLKDLGVQADKSDEERKGEVEFIKKKSTPMEEHTMKIQNFEYMLNQSPQDLKTLTRSVIENKNEIKTGIGNVQQAVNDVQQWLIVQKQNDELREQNKLLNDQNRILLDQLKEMNKQIDELKSAVGFSSLKRDDSLQERYRYIGYA